MFKPQMKFQKILFPVLIALSGVVFVYSLGIMTDMYGLYQTQALGGVFAYKLSYVLSKSRELLGTSSYEELVGSYADLKKISFDYAVVEQETSIEVLRYSGTWKDLGTWNTLTEAMEENTVGDVQLNETCSNVHVINELGVPILVMGGSDLVIAASSEGILVSDKDRKSTRLNSSHPTTSRMPSSA